jgi:3-isopropylmalate/(R)-2-methylmalate dehydratase large subunit
MFADHPTIDIWKKEFGENAKIWDKDKLVIFPDHYIFTANKHANRNVDIFVNLQRIITLKITTM